MTAAPRWDEAMALARRGVEPLETEETPVGAAAGRTLAVDVAAPVPLPHFASCAMDGFAVAGPPPWRRRAAASVHPGAPLARGEACPVVTGGTVPAGAAGVVRHEYTEDRDGVIAFRADAPRSELEPGRHVRPAGTEAGAGDRLLAAGAVLAPARIALAAVAGLDTLPVRRRLRVALLRTGDEVVGSGLPEPGRVRDAFGPALPALLAGLGGALVHHVHVPDTAAATEAALDAALADLPGGAADVVLTTGATARSPVDHVRRVVEARAVEVRIPELGLRPGHPTMLTRLPRPGGGEPAWHVGLPGNPLAAMTALRVVAQPLLEALLGRPVPPVPRGVLADEARPGKADRLVPVRRVDPADPASAWRECGHVGSAMLRGLADAEALAVLPASGVPAGGVVPLLPLAGGGGL